MLISCVCWNIPFPTSKDCTVHPEIRRLELQILGWTIHQLHTVAVQTPKRTSQAKDNQWSEWRSREPHELHVTARTEFPKHIKQQLHITKNITCIKHAMHSSIISKHFSGTLSHLFLSSYRLCIKLCILAVLCCQILCICLSLWSFQRVDQPVHIVHRLQQQMQPRGSRRNWCSRGTTWAVALATAMPNHKQTQSGNKKRWVIDSLTLCIL